jgi:hypothetical protein
LAFQGTSPSLLKSWSDGSHLGYIWQESVCEATLLAAYQSFLETGNNKVFLTLVGGGVFVNKRKWIITGIVTAIKKANLGLG